MGRTIPSFRQLLEIEKLDWSTFKKQLPTKKDKQAFDMIFENAKLYTSYLGNAVNPIVFESTIMGSIFNNYKTLLQKSKVDNKIDNFTITQELTLLTENNPTGKILFDRTCKKWHGLIDSLHKGDRELLLKMIFEICNYDEDYNKMIDIHDSKLFIDYFFFFASIMQQQKLINKLNGNSRNKNASDGTLLYFMIE
jgi:hypothetical protein